MLPNNRDAAKQQLVEVEIRGALARLGIEPITDPAAEYARLAGEVVGFRDLCRAEVDKLTTWVGFNKDEEEFARALVVVYERAQDRSQKTLADMLKIGLTAEALGVAKSRPSREQAEALRRVMDRVFNALNLTPEQHRQAPQAVRDAIMAEGLV